MTKLPMEDQNVKPLRGNEWPSYSLNIICAAPGCTEIHLERHHVWRKSFIGGDVWWVELPDGTAVANCVGLCNAHHKLITDNVAEIAIALSDEKDLFEFFWCDPIAGVRHLSWQPPVSPTQSEFDDLPPEFYEIHENECPTCHRALPKPKVENPEEKKKIRRTWSITVPKDEAEDGAELLDRYLEEIREELGKRDLSYSDSPKARYFILSTAMALFLTHAEDILS